MNLNYFYCNIFSKMSSYLKFIRLDKFPDSFFDNNDNLKHFLSFVCLKKKYTTANDWYKCSNKKLSEYGFENKTTISVLLNKVYGTNYFIESEFVSNKKRNCKAIGCKVVRPVFNYSGNTKGIYCDKHKLENMVNVRSRICEYPDCNIHSGYNYENFKTPKFCIEHKLDGMINVTSKKCEYPECYTQPGFGFENEAPKFCVKHKLNGMIEVRNKRCENPECNKNPSFGFENQAPRFCSKHKLVGTINVKSKLCENPECNKHPSYSFENESPRFCFEHKLEGMNDYKSKRCENPDCNKRPTYNYEDEKRPIFCVKHKSNDMIDVINKRCKTHLCPTIVHRKYEGYCLRCYINIYPDIPVTRNYKTKEKTIVDFVKENFKELNIITDKIITNGCSKRRPDILIELGHRIIIVEVDENQHTDYDCSCENKRIMEIYQDAEFRPIVFIRFNPDGYYNTKGKKIKSCWGSNNKGIFSVIHNKKDEWNLRLKNLKNQINYWVKNESDKSIEIVQLYYDLN
jgi:hypothetical protein